MVVEDQDRSKTGVFGAVRTTTILWYKMLSVTEIVLALAYDDVSVKQELLHQQFHNLYSQTTGGVFGAVRTTTILWYRMLSVTEIVLVLAYDDI
ncbi:hypothetical protein PoB_007456400 [Plakobranchus ocellatus]|uniref:Uncharacterized protein n=1 Tax=Plakobranchus ocellatus TaxID=259542 RepID=A0AAV4DVL3_9GAST|nr:hypothetical protein PoB_007456400 [Plakobranchus ocellatus]